MPWTVKDVDGFKKGLSNDQKKQWVAVANSALKSCMDEGGSEEACAASAVIKANGVIKKQQQEAESMGEAHMSETKRKLGKHEFVLSDFLVYGSKDDPSTWNLPVRHRGKPDAGLMERAWHALHGGYKGQVYGGPLKELAVKRLSKLYDETGWYTPQEAGDVGRDRFTELMDRVARLEELVQRLVGDGEPEPNETAESDFDESASGHAVEIEEDGTEADTPMRLSAVLIRPGWGNERDKNYYTEDMLRRDAEVFVDAKMFEKNHTPDKNNRDWVSTVDRILGVSGEGVLAEVVVHDQNFADRARALQKANKLHLLECSIQARGTARAGKVNGKEGHIVERITEARAVDWVTKAGAGGHAVGIAGE